MKIAHAFDFQGFGADTLDMRAHRDEAIAQIDNFRLARDIFQDRWPACQHRRHHGVFGSADADQRKHIAATGQPAPGGCLHITGSEFDFGPQMFERLQVQIDRPVADGAAAGQ